MKKCTKCNEEKELNEFPKRKGTKDGLNTLCKSCIRNIEAIWRQANAQRVIDKRKAWYRLDPNKRKDGKLQRNYGITLTQYSQMLIEQNNVCAVCEQPETAKDMYGNTKTLVVDHCHKTNIVRGLLCQCCNHAEGQLKSDPVRIRRLADYVEKHNKNGQE